MRSYVCLELERGGDPVPVVTRCIQRAKQDQVGSYIHTFIHTYIHTSAYNVRVGGCSDHRHFWATGKQLRTHTTTHGKPYRILLVILYVCMYVYALLGHESGHKEGNS